jgi:hypothetical protein
MSIRNAVLGLTLIFGLAAWAWCRPGESQAQAQSPGDVYATSEAGDGGNHEEAAIRFRTNQSRHWRQIAGGNGIYRP